MKFLFPLRIKSFRFVPKTIVRPLHRRSFVLPRGIALPRDLLPLLPVKEMDNDFSTRLDSPFAASESVSANSTDIFNLENCSFSSSSGLRVDTPSLRRQVVGLGRKRI